MKKRFSVLTLALVGFLMMATGVYASEVFERWAGEHNYDATLVIFEDLKDGIISKDEAIETLKDENSSLESDNGKLAVQITNLSADKKKLQEALDSKNANSIDKEIIKSELESLIAGANKENGLGNKYPYIIGKLNKYATDLGSESELKPQNEGGKSDQLRQAEIDMEDVYNKAKELQLEMNKNEPNSDPEL